VNLLEQEEAVQDEQLLDNPLEENRETNFMVLFDLHSGHTIVWSSLLISSSNLPPQSLHSYS